MNTSSVGAPRCGGLLFRVCTLVAGFACLFALSLQAQPASSGGTIVGTVANATTKQFLRTAEIRVEGTNLVTFSDADGSFRLSNVPAGPQRVTVTYAGIDPETQSVVVSPGEPQRLDFNLRSDFYQMDEFVIAGAREGQAKAVNDQRNADHMKSIIASDAFGDLVDSNAAELLKSLPGFAMNYAGEDAIGFVMRGQSSVYASVTMDGNGIPNSGFGSRAMNMRNVTVNNIESIEVNRAPNAAQPANSMGGSVNLVSKSAFSQQGRRIRVDLGVNINSEVSDWGSSYQGFDADHHAQFGMFQINYSDTFREETEHPIGVTLSLLRGGRYRYNTQYTPNYTYVPALTTGQQVDPSTPAIANTANIQEASAGFIQLYYSANFDFRLTDNTTLYLRTFYQEGPQRHLYGMNHRIVPTAGGQTAGNTVLNGNTADRIDSRPNATPVGPGSSSGSRIQKATGHEVSENEVYQYNFGGKTRLGELVLDYNTFYGRDFYRNPINGFREGGTLTYDVTNVGFIMDNIQSPGEMTLEQTSGADYRDVSNFGRLTWSGSNSITVDRKYGGRADATRTFNNWRYPVILQGGLAYDIQARTANRTGEGARYLFGSGPDGVFGNGDDVDLPLEQFVDTRLTEDGWNMRGFPTIDPGQFIDMSKLAEYVAANPTAATHDPRQDVTNFYGSRKDFEETIEASYLMATIRFGDLTVVPGVRWERTTDEGEGYARATLPTPAGLTLQQEAEFIRSQYRPVNRKASYDDFYPNFQARYNVTNNFLVRTSYTETIGRPNFTSLLPGDTINTTNSTISRNNPDLEPFDAKNYDLSLEYYFGRNTGSLTAAVFRKEITNYFQSTQFVLPGGPDNGYDGDYEGYLVSESRNIDGETKTEGYELGYQQALRFLPGIWGNLSASASYTHVSATPAPGQRSVTGIYPDVYNLGLTYNDRNLRVDLKYNMRESWLTSVNSANGQREYFQDNDRLDLAINYTFRNRYTFYFDWRNFMNERDTRFVEGRMRFWQEAGMSINTGLRADF